MTPYDWIIGVGFGLLIVASPVLIAKLVIDAAYNGRKEQPIPVGVKA